MNVEISFTAVNYMYMHFIHSFTVTYVTKNGGFRLLYDQDNKRNLPIQHYKGQTTKTTVEFRFDFIAPVHCTEIESSVKCTKGEKPIDIKADITKVNLHFYFSNHTSF